MPDAPMTTGCTQPGQAGNSLGVGKYCTRGGGQCAQNPSAIFCTVDYVPSAPDWLGANRWDGLTHAASQGR